MLKIIYNIFSFLCLASVSACGYMKKESDVEIRLVDINGNSRNIATRIPDLNLKALAEQGKLYSAVKEVGNANKNSQTQPQNFEVANSNLVRDKSYNNIVINPENQDDSANDFGEFSTRTIDNTFSQETNRVNAQPKEIEYDLGQESIKKENLESNVKPIQDSEEQEIISKNNDKKLLIIEKNNKSQSNKPAARVQSNKKEIFVQVGSFSKYDNASKFLKYMNKFHKGEIQTVKTRSGEIHRVVLGPMPTIDKANSSIQDIKNSGHDAILLINK